MAGVMDVLTGETSVVRRPGSRSRLEVRLAKAAISTAVATGVVMIVGIVMLVVQPWSTPEPPAAVALTMTLVPVGGLTAVYAAIGAVGRARNRRDILTGREIASMPLPLAGPWLQANEAVRAIRAADGHHSVRAREAAEIQWAMAEHVKTAAALYIKVPAVPISEVHQGTLDAEAAMQDLADWLTALAAR
ncbi:hypothetical protein GS531_23085 [Rhodococcus hoagii]|nr:hypothetical protein [Prescottella equi]